jgi:prolyl-tRNA synthetase
MVNQWANVVRWEMRTRLFLRTTEFLWQEGHTCHATAEEAEAETRTMLGVYRDFAEEMLAMPVYWGRKSDAERFAGALRTYCIEGMMQDKKALQAGTSHNLSTNFAKAFETKFLDKDSTQKLVHQTSWGVSTRLIGGMVMTHSDDKGLVLPPRLARTHVVIVPIMPKPDTKQAVIDAAKKLKAAIEAEAAVKALPYEIGVEVDDDDTKQAGWKFHEHELVGTPVRIEIGPRDLEKGTAVFTRRDIGKKEFIPLGELPAKIGNELAAMQKDLLEKARAFRDANTFEIDTYQELKDKVEDGGFFIASFCGSPDLEKKIKEETKATIRCLPLDENYEPKKSAKPCFISGEKSDRNTLAIFARSY